MCNPFWLSHVKSPLKLGQVWTYKQLKPLQSLFSIFHDHCMYFWDFIDHDVMIKNGVLCSYLCLMEPCASISLFWKSVLKAEECASSRRLCASCCALDVQYRVTLATWFLIKVCVWFFGCWIWIGVSFLKWDPSSSLF